MVGQILLIVAGLWGSPDYQTREKMDRVMRRLPDFVLYLGWGNDPDAEVRHRVRAAVHPIYYWKLGRKALFRTLGPVSDSAYTEAITMLGYYQELYPGYSDYGCMDLVYAHQLAYNLWRVRRW